MLLLIGAAASILVSLTDLLSPVYRKDLRRVLTRTLLDGFWTVLLSVCCWRYLLGQPHFLTAVGLDTMAYFKFFLCALAIGVLTHQLHRTYDTMVPRPSNKRRGAALVWTAVPFVGYLCLFISLWGKTEFGDMSIDQLIINLVSPVSGANDTDFVSALEGPVLLTILATSVTVLLFVVLRRILAQKQDLPKSRALLFLRRHFAGIASAVILLGGMSYGIYAYHLTDVIHAYLSKSTIIDDNYVDPRDVNIQFPEKKRNLIHIYLESMENSYMSKDLGGFMDENLIPELTQLATEGYSFSHLDQGFGGPQSAVGTTWSVASMVNMTTGLPMKTPTEPNAYGSADNFLPGACTLGDLLAQQGYEQTVMFGADADFGGLTYYYRSHGDFKIMDYKYAKQNGLIPKNYQVWWGFEDDKLFSFAKEEITRLSQTGKPFHFAMETADTHRPDGYLSPHAPTPHENQYANVLSYNSAQVYEFVRWIQQQPFYDNTTVVIIGDHLSMETNFFEFYDFDEDYHRSQYNVILNPAPSVPQKRDEMMFNRVYANFDMFPTILSSMGVTIEGSRLGIGTDLFSGKKTLFEEYGFEYANEELGKMSVLYNREILQ